MNVQSLIPLNYSIMILSMFVINGVICSICVCRLMRMHDVLIRVKVQYILGLVASAANGLAPLFFQQWPNGTAVLFAAWVCSMLLLDGYQWGGGRVPEAAIVQTPETSDEPEPKSVP